MLDPVLIVEDDIAIRRAIADALRHRGYEPIEVGDGAAGARFGVAQPVRLVLLDLSLPQRDGLEVLRELRDAKPGLPILIISARGDEDDRVRGLQLGADDYIVKPFGIRELLARIEAVLRRSPERAVALQSVQVGDARVDLAAATIAFDDGEICELTTLESRLLAYLAAHPERMVSRAELLRQVWEVDPRRIRTRAVDMAITRLRRKLRDDGPGPRALHSLRGHGYRLECR